MSAKRQRILDTFVEFLRNEARSAAGLYILGDMFDQWIGDDYVPDEYKTVIKTLSNLAQSGTPVFVQHGNRDFLLGETFIAQSRCQLLTDPTLIDLYGTKTLIMHGDILCSDDADYQTFRKQVRKSQWQKEFLARPIAERLALAQQARRQSNQEKDNKSEQIMDVNQQTVETTMAQWNVHQLIHGHTHRPGTHSLTANHQAATRIVLGDWYDHGNYLRCDQSGCSVHQLTFPS